MPPKDDAVTIKVKGKDYDINRDFTWDELIQVEDIVGKPLNENGVLDSIRTGAAFIFVVLKRDDSELAWADFIKRPLSEFEQPDEEPAAKGAAKARPTRRAAG